MTNCAVTLALAYGSSQPYIGEHLRVGPLTPFADAGYWVTADFEDIPLTSPPMVRNFVQGQTYGFIEPDGTQIFKTIPASSSSSYAALPTVVPLPPGPVMTYTKAQVDAEFVHAEVGADGSTSLYQNGVEL